MAIQDSLGKSIQSELANPTSLDPMKTAAVGQINANSDNLQTRLQNTESARGFGASGRLGLKSANLEINRTNQVNSLEDQFAQMQLDQNNKVRAQAQQFGFQSPTMTTTPPGSPLAAGLGAGSESLTTLFYLNKLLKGGGSIPEGSGTEATGMPGGEWQNGDDGFTSGDFAGETTYGSGFGGGEG